MSLIVWIMSLSPILYLESVIYDLNAFQQGLLFHLMQQEVSISQQQFDNIVLIIIVLLGIL